MNVRETQRTDPILVEIVRGALKSCGDEMDAVVVRTSMSPFIREKGDHFAGVADQNARILYTTHDRAGPGMLDTIFERFPPESMSPGDVYWVSDPYVLKGAISHSPDMCFIAPVFFREAIVAYSLCFGHFFDIGGARPGSIFPHATDVFQEGITVPQVRIVAGGQLNEDLYRTVLRNSRFPDMLEGDTRAMMAATHLGQSRMLELFERYGSVPVQTAFEELHSRSERVVRSYIRDNVRPGRYSFSDYVDNDCVSDTPYRVQMEMEVTGDEVTVVDCSGSDDQARGPINFLMHPEICRMVFTRLLLSHEATALQNAGASRAIGEVRLRKGSLLQPVRPAPLGLRGHTMWRVVSAALGLFAEATDGKVAAGSPDFVVLNMRTVDTRTGEMMLITDGLGAGQGARPFADGLDVIYAGRAQRNYPMEFIEGEFPVRVERYGIQPDSAGPGLHRGGVGMIREYRILAEEVTLATRMANLLVPAWGTSGGLAGRTGGIVVNPDLSSERRLPGFGDGIKLQRGDLLRVVSHGGGGYGNALDREPQSVMNDVADGFVSIGGALSDYGVVVDPATLAVDLDATHRYRARRREEEGKSRAGFDRGERFEAMEGSRRKGVGLACADSRVAANRKESAK